MFSGDLFNDAQGVYQSLRRCGLHHSVLEQIAACYRTAWETGALEELDSKRTARTSFNPRPARLMAIAIRELGYPVPITGFEQILLKLATNPTKSESLEISDQFTAIVEGIILIDDFRHAHLQPDSKGKRIEDFEEFEGLLPARLMTLLKFAHKNALMLKDAENEV